MVALEAMAMGETLHGEIMVVVQGDFASVTSGPIAAVVDAPRDLAGKKVVIIRDTTLINDQIHSYLYTPAFATSYQSNYSATPRGHWGLALDRQDE